MMSTGPSLRTTAAVLLVSLSVVGSALAAAPAGQYTLTSSTAQDRRTGLIWQRNADMTRRTAAGADSYCSGLDGGAGWRVPSVRELMTLVDPGATAAPTIDATAFPGTGSQKYWTTTTYADPNMTGAKWAVDFNNGVPNGVTVANTMLLVRCVR